MLSRERHLKSTKRILVFLKIFPKGRIIVNKTYQYHSNCLVEDHPKWKDFYPGAEEENTQ
jgi:hypothetical protein